MVAKPQYLIDTHWLAGNAKPKWVVWLEYALYAVALTASVIILYFYFSIEDRSFRGFGMLLSAPIAVIAMAQFASRYLFTRKQVGHIRFTTEHIILKGPETRKIEIAQLGSLRIDFDFDRTRAHRLWISSEIGGKEENVLFTFINRDDFRKFNNLMEMLPKMGIELTPETRRSLNAFAVVMQKK